MLRRPFRGRGHGIEVGLEAGERELLVQLLQQLDQLLDDGRPEPTDPLAELVGFDLPFPGADDAEGAADGRLRDPALARLLPNGNRQDPEAAAEFRRLTETGLRSRKRQNARRAAAALGAPSSSVTLATEDAGALLTALTDLRLVLAERLDLHTDEDAERLHHELRARAAPGAGPADPWAASAAIYDILTMWQESLVAALTSRKQRRSQA